MKAVGQFFAGMLSGAKSGNSSIQNEWEKARADAARFGPSHVAEIDAIFARQA